MNVQDTGGERTQEFAPQDLIIVEGDIQVSRHLQPQLLAAIHIGCGYDLEVVSRGKCDHRLLSMQSIKCIDELDSQSINKITPMISLIDAQDFRWGPLDYDGEDYSFDLIVEPVNHRLCEQV